MLVEQIQRSLEPIVTFGGLVEGGYSAQTHALFVLGTTLMMMTVLCVIAKLRGATRNELFDICRDVLWGALYTMTFILILGGFSRFGSAIRRAFTGHGGALI